MKKGGEGCALWLRPCGRKAMPKVIPTFNNDTGDRHRKRIKHDTQNAAASRRRGFCCCRSSSFLRAPGDDERAQPATGNGKGRRSPASHIALPRSSPSPVCHDQNLTAAGGSVQPASSAPDLLGARGQSPHTVSDKMRAVARSIPYGPRKRQSAHTFCPLLEPIPKSVAVPQPGTAMRLCDIRLCLLHAVLDAGGHDGKLAGGEFCRTAT